MNSWLKLRSIKKSLKDGRTIEFSKLSVNLTNPQEKKQAKSAVFQGLFFVIRGPNVLHNLDGLTIIKPKKRPKSTTKTASSSYDSTILDADLINSSVSQQKTAFPFFDPYYTIEGQSSQQALSYFSDAFYETLYDIYSHLKQDIHLSIERNNVYFALPTSSKIWDLNLQQSLTNTPTLDDLAVHWALVFDLIEYVAQITSLNS